VVAIGLDVLERRAELESGTHAIFWQITEVRCDSRQCCPPVALSPQQLEYPRRDHLATEIQTRSRRDVMASALQRVG
jgi:hypothetical protein